MKGQRKAKVAVEERTGLAKREGDTRDKKGYRQKIRKSDPELGTTAKGEDFS